MSRLPTICPMEQEVELVNQMEDLDRFHLVRYDLGRMLVAEGDKR